MCKFNKKILQEGTGATSVINMINHFYRRAVKEKKDSNSVCCMLSVYEAENLLNYMSKQQDMLDMCRCSSCDLPEAVNKLIKMHEGTVVIGIDLAKEGDRTGYCNVIKKVKDDGGERDET